jgi:WD40 repeat protein
VLFAAAAWEESKTREAYAALMSQYQQTQSVERMLGTPGGGEIEDMVVSPDGRIVVTEDRSGEVTVWYDVLTGGHERWQLPGERDVWELTLTRDGRRLAVLDNSFAVTVWDTEARSGPIQVRPPEAVPQVDGNVAMAFTPSGDRLVVSMLSPTASDGKLAVEGWQITSATQEFRFSPPGIKPVINIAFPDSNTVVLGTYGPNSTSELLRAYDIRTGTEVAPPPGTTLSRQGVASFGCRDGMYQVWDLATLRVHTPEPPPCSASAGLKADNTGRYLVSTEGSFFGYLNIVDAATGLASRVLAPPRAGQGPWVVARDDGSLAVLLHYGSTLYLLHAPAPRRLSLSSASPASSYLAPRQLLTRDRTVRAVVSDVEGALASRVRLFDVGTGDPLSGDETTAPIVDWGNTLAFGADGHLLLALDRGALVVYEVPTLAERLRLQLPVPDNLGPSHRSRAGTDIWRGSIRVTPDNVAIVLYAGLISRVHLATGKLLGQPLAVRPGGGELRHAADNPQLTLRPRHSNEVLMAASPTAHELWDLETQRKIADIPIRTGVLMTNSIIFDDDGERIASLTDDKIEIWELAQQGRPPLTITAPKSDSIVGIVGEYLFTLEPIEQLVVWDVHTGQRLAATELPGTLTGEHFDRSALVAFGPNGLYEVPLDPELWHKHLCRIGGREFTDVERRLLPSPDQRSPCR